MTDTYKTIGATGIKKFLHDNSDGTYSDGVYVMNITGGTISNLAVMGSDGADTHTLLTNTSGALLLGDARTAVSGFSTETGAQTDKALIALVSTKIIHVQRLIVTNDNTAAITVLIETDTASGKTALTPAMKVPVSTVAVFDFGDLGILGTVSKNIGFTSTGTSNYTVQVVGYAV